MKPGHLELIRQSFAGKKVFLTGHTGFKGSWMLKWLHMLGANVKGYALPPDQDYSLYKQLDGDSLGTSVVADIRDADRVREEVISFQPDFVFHLAAQSLVRRSYEVPIETFDVNVMGTANVLDALRSLDKNCAVILITTDKVYENGESMTPYHESEPLGGNDPYSASKAACELVINSYRNSFFSADNYKEHGKAIASARAGNVIGGGDWALDRVMPDLVRAFSKSEPLRIRNPESIRPWQHVLEPLGGYLLLGAKIFRDPHRFSGAWNFGPKTDDTLRVRELVQVAKKYWEGVVDFQNPSGQPHEAVLLRLDITKAMELMDWTPLYSSAEGVRLTIEWYKAVVMNHEPAVNWVESQIRAYEAK